MATLIRYFDIGQGLKVKEVLSLQAKWMHNNGECFWLIQVPRRRNAASTSAYRYMMKHCKMPMWSVSMHINGLHG